MWSINRWLSRLRSRSKKSVYREKEYILIRTYVEKFHQKTLQHAYKAYSDNVLCRHDPVNVSQSTDKSKPIFEKYQPLDTENNAKVSNFIVSYAISWH